MSLFKREEYKDDLNQCKNRYQMKKFYEKNTISDDGKSSNSLPVYWKEDINRYKHANCVDTAICAYCISRENDIPAKIYCIDFDCSFQQGTQVFTIFQMRIKENWGAGYTCLYRFRVHQFFNFNFNFMIVFFLQYTLDLYC